MSQSIKWIGAHPNNYFVGRAGRNIDRIVLHWIVGPLSAADSTFQNPGRQASAHYGVGNSTIHQYVKDIDTAYHSGHGDTNLRSIGIEHAGGPNHPITEATIQASARLVADLCRRYNIPCNRTHIRKHNEISATQCPGTLDVDRMVALAQQHLQGGTVTQEDIFNSCWITRSHRWPTPAEREAWRKSGLAPYTHVQKFAPSPELDKAKVDAFKIAWIAIAHRWPTDKEVEAWKKSGLSAYEFTQRHASNPIVAKKEEEIRELNIALEKCELTSGTNAELGRRVRALVEEVS